MQAARADLWASALPFMRDLLGRLHELARRTLRLQPQAPIPGLSAADSVATVQLLNAPGTPPRTPETNFLAYWLLMAAPWPARVASEHAPWQPVARTFGALFDIVSLPHSRVRDLANFWSNWADKRIFALARARLIELEARGEAA